MNVRLLEPADAEAFRELRLEALTLHPTNFLTTAAEFAKRTLEDHRGALSRGKSWGLFDGDRLNGMGALLPMTFAAAAHRAEIGAVYVRKAQQGTGAADALMHGLVQAAVSYGVWQLELFVADDNLRAQRFYARHGFREAGRLPNAALVGGVMTSDIFMVADLR
ncbi:MAG: GNAT family N-acetyltransferase [Pseudomonadota bacterium]